MLVQEVTDNHKNRMMLIESRQKDYNFLMNECKQLCEDKHYAADKVRVIQCHGHGKVLSSIIILCLSLCNLIVKSCKYFMKKCKYSLLNRQKPS